MPWLSLVRPWNTSYILLIKFGSFGILFLKKQQPQNRNRILHLLNFPGVICIEADFDFVLIRRELCRRYIVQQYQTLSGWSFKSFNLIHGLQRNASSKIQYNLLLFSTI